MTTQANRTNQKKTIKPLTAEQQALVDENIRLAFKFSKRFQPPCGLNYDEWQAECLCFLVHAARRYIPGKSKFSTCAWISMRYGMFDYVRDTQTNKRDWRRTQQINDEHELGAEDLSVQKKIQMDELREELVVLIQRLPNPLWQEVWLKRMDGKVLEEICKELLLSKTKIKNVYKYGLIYLQNLVARSNPELAKKNG